MIPTNSITRQQRTDRPRLLYCQLCDPEGRPIAVEVFQGNTTDPKTLTQIIAQVWKRFGITNAVVVGDRGMITANRINEDFLRKDEVEGSSALRTDGIQSLVDEGKISRSLFDKNDRAEIPDEEDFPGERLILCRNRLLADERAPRREALLIVTETDQNRIVALTQRKRNPLSGEDAIGLAVGQVIGKHKMKRYLELTVTEKSFAYERREVSNAAEAHCMACT